MWYLIALSVYALLVTLYVTFRMNYAEFHDRDYNPKIDCGSWKKCGIFSFYLFALILFSLVAFRASNVGNDTASYLRTFRSIVEAGGFAGSRTELGYQAFNVFVSKISSNPQAIIIATSLFIYGLATAYFQKHSVNPWIVLTLFFATTYSGSVNTIRQTMAGVLLLYAYQADKDNKTGRAILITIVAGLLHTVGFAFLLYILIRRIPFKVSVAAVALALLLILSFTGDFLLDLFIRVLPKYAEYLEGDRVGSGWVGITFQLGVRIIAIIIYYIGTDQEERATSTQWLLFGSVACTVCGYAMNLFTRPAELFELIVIMPICNEILTSKRKCASVLLLALCTLYLGVFLFTAWYRPNWTGMYPYSFFGD